MWKQWNKRLSGLQIAKLSAPAYCFCIGVKVIVLCKDSSTFYYRIQCLGILC